MRQSNNTFLQHGVQTMSESTRNKFEMHKDPRIGDWYEDGGCGEYMVHTVRETQVADDLDNLHVETEYVWVRVGAREEVDDEMNMLRGRGLLT
jgi:hypothetical protein